MEVCPRGKRTFEDIFLGGLYNDEMNFLLESWKQRMEHRWKKPVKIEYEELSVKSISSLWNDLASKWNGECVGIIGRPGHFLTVERVVNAGQRKNSRYLLFVDSTKDEKDLESYWESSCSKNHSNKTDCFFLIKRLG